MKCRPINADVQSVCAYVRVDELHTDMHGIESRRQRANIGLHSVKLM